MPGPFPYVDFTQDNLPDWCCPACLNASLELVPGSFTESPSAFSLLNRGADWYDVEHEEFVFTCMLTCSRRSCRESVAVSGTGRGDSEPDDRHQDMTYYTLYRAKSFVPPLPMFSIPTDCPDDIADQLRNIAALLPVSRGAAVNAIRITIEIMLDTQDVPRQTEGNNPQRIWLTQRILSNREKLGRHYDAFHALKDFGNHGSHTDQPIRRSDIQGACLVLDNLIRQLYGADAEHTRIVTRLASRYGKRSKDAQ